MADHNDPNAVNSIFSDIDVSAADVYDLFGFPGDETTSGEKVVIALTFAPVPETGVYEEVADFVSEDVATKLDPGRSYGIW